MSNPLVTAIVAVFNGERFLAEAIESILAQDYRPLEVIVVDDASTDASAAVASSFEEVIVIRRAGNGGPSVARNDGIARARGDLITFLDADDKMTADRLETQAGTLMANPEIGCVLMGQELLLEGAAGVPTWLRPFGEPEDVVPGLMISAMARRALFERVGGFDPTYRLCVDVDWLFRVREAGVGIELLTQIGVIRRIHEDNATHQVEGVRAAMARAVRARLERSRAAGGGVKA